MHAQTEHLRLQGRAAILNRLRAIARDCQLSPIVVPNLAEQLMDVAGALDGAAPELVICAAIRMRDGYVIRGHRHCDCFHTASGIPRYADAKGRVEQGFVTSANRFVDRREARHLHEVVNGCVSASPDGYRGDDLYSEDLY